MVFPETAASAGWSCSTPSLESKERILSHGEIDGEIALEGAIEIPITKIPMTNALSDCRAWPDNLVPVFMMAVF